jgi:elongation factor G
LIEALADHDDAFAANFLDGKEITKEEIKRVLRKATISGKFFPMMCGSSFKNKGVQPMLDAVCDYLPSPLDVKPTIGHEPNSEKELVREPKDDAPFAALAFKIQSDPHVGKVTYFRVYSGMIKSGSYVFNANTGNRNGWAAFFACTRTSGKKSTKFTRAKLPRAWD